MTNNRLKGAMTHPTENDLAGYLAGSLPQARRREVEGHIARCDECLCAVVSAHESVGPLKPGRKRSLKEKIAKAAKRFNIYLALAAVSFALSFIVPRYFIQLLVATLLFGIKWIVDAKTTRMLVMIYDAWKHGGEKEASKVLERIGQRDEVRF